MKDEVNIPLTNERAVKYARWLAKRDGINIPETYEAAVIWGNHKFVQYVTFGVGPNLIEIEIPNWDWEPNKEAA